MKRGTSVSIRGKRCPTWEIIQRMQTQGFDREEIRRICRALEITNFTSTWGYDARIDTGGTRQAA
jgi:uncharacterized protein (DUF433 family)